MMLSIEAKERTQCRFSAVCKVVFRNAVCIAALTHDIKTPLTLVKGNAELLLESELSKEPLELAATIHRYKKD